MKSNNYLILISLSLLPILSALGQSNSCIDAVFEADKLFKSGKTKACIIRLEPCISSGIKGEDLFDAYRLLALAYQEEQDDQKTSIYMRKMLKAKPDYREFPSIDPITFTKNLNKFSVIPKVYGGIKAGISASQAHLIKSYSAYSGKQSYISAVGWQGLLFTDLMVGKKMYLHTYFGVNRLPIIHQMNEAAGKSIIMTETYQFVNLGTQANYTFPKFKKFVCSGGLGGGISYLRKSSVLIESEDLKSEFVKLVTKASTQERNRWQPYFSFGARIEYPSGKGFFGISTTWDVYITPTVIASERLNDLSFIFSNGYVHDDISLRNLSFNLFYRHPIFYQIK